MRVQILRKYWPSNAKSDADAIDADTVLDLPDDEAIKAVNADVAKLVPTGTKTTAEAAKSDATSAADAKTANGK